MKVIIEKNAPNKEISRNIAQMFTDQFLFKIPNFTIFFEGGLGSGKTFFTKEILTHLGAVSEITSPTYTLCNEYVCKNNNIHAHFDFYRFENPSDFFTRGFSDMATDSNVSCFVEWTEKIPSSAKDLFSGERFVVKIEHGVRIGTRKIKILHE